LTPLTGTRGYRPLTERILAALGRPRPLWIVVLAALPWLRDAVQYVLLVDAGAVNGAWLAARVPVAITNSYLIVLSIWGTVRVTRKLAEVDGSEEDGDADVADVADVAGPTVSGASWTVWLLPPVLLAIALTAVLEAGRVLDLGVAAARSTPLPFILGGLIGFVMRLAPMTGFWTALLVLVELDRLGARRSQPADFPPDRSLGMRPVGELAFMVFWLVAAAFVPIFIVRSPSLLDVLVSVTFFAGEGAILVLALWRLHRGMVRTKGICLAEGRERYAQAYRAALDDPHGQDMGRHAHALAVAESLLRGAESIQEWPLDDRMLRAAALIGVGVTTGVTVRFMILLLGV
jgi:hypothetical protein